MESQAHLGQRTPSTAHLEVAAGLNLRRDDDWGGVKDAGGGDGVLGITQVPVVGRGFPRLPVGICFMCPQQRYTKGMTKPRLNGFASELSHPVILSGPISTVLYKDNSIRQRLCEEQQVLCNQQLPAVKMFLMRGNLSFILVFNRAALL